MSLNALATICAEVHAGRGQLHWTDSLQWALRGDVLAFAGSDSLRDWWHNLKLWPARSNTGPGWVHAGFLALARATWPQIKQTVLGGGRIRTVTGYSLGAGVALLVAEVLRGVEVVTFACPPVGNWAWARRYPHLVRRCWVSPDWVTRPMLGRCQLGHEVCLPGGWSPLRNHLYTLERTWPECTSI